MDRDGVINEPPIAARYITRPEELRLVPGAAEGIQRFRKAGFLAIVVTNQRGIATGEITIGALQAIHERLKVLLAAAGSGVDDILYCPHCDEDECPCRKPKPGLILRAAETHHVSLRNSLLIGDSERDIAAGRTVGCRTVQLQRGDRPVLQSMADASVVSWRQIGLNRARIEE